MWRPRATRSGADRAADAVEGDDRGGSRDDLGPLGARVQYLTQAYSDLLANVELLCAKLEQLRAYHGAERVLAWQQMAQAGHFETLAQELVTHHYDPRYPKAQSRHARAPLATIPMQGLTDVLDLDAAVGVILALSL